MKLPATPAVMGEGKPATVIVLAAAGLTVMPAWLPVTLAVSGVGRRDRLRAGRLQRGAEGMHAGVGGGEGVVGRQRRPVPSELVKWTTPV